MGRNQVGFLTHLASLTEDDAFLTDEQLLEELRQHPQTKDRIVLEFFGKNLRIWLFASNFMDRYLITGFKADEKHKRQ